MAEYKLTERFKDTQNEFDLPVIQTVSFGNGKAYFVEKNGIPYLKAETDSVSEYFDKACIFGKYLCMGVGCKVIFVNLETLGSLSREVSDYFGYFFIHDEKLYIASGRGITALDSSLHLLWCNENLAIDGVIIHEVTEDGKYLRVSCEMNPPGDWCEKLVSLANGECSLDKI